MRLTYVKPINMLATQSPSQERRRMSLMRWSKSVSQSLPKICILPLIWKGCLRPSSPKTRAKPTSSVLYGQDLNDPRLNFDYNGIRIRSTTLYDTLAYVLSVTGTLPSNITPNPVRDYYLPLASLYANWCTKIAEYVKDNRGIFLYHIAWFTTTARPATKVLLGSTIGSNESLRTDIKDTRAATLQSLHYAVPPLIQEQQNFGGCAETSFFMYVKQ